MQWCAPLASHSSIYIYLTTLKPSGPSCTPAVHRSHTSTGSRRAASSSHRWHTANTLVFLVESACKCPDTDVSFSLWCSCLLVGAQLATVGRVSGQVSPDSIPADCRVCLGLVGRPLLDVSLRYCERCSSICAGSLRAVETLGKSQDQVHRVGGLGASVFLLCDTRIQSHTGFFHDGNPRPFNLELH